MHVQPQDIFGSAGDTHLTPEEKTKAWARIRSHMQVLPPLAQEQAMQEEDTEIVELLESACACAEEGLNALERQTVWSALQIETSASAFFADAQAERLGQLEKQSILSALQARMAEYAERTAEPAPSPEPAPVSSEAREPAFLHWSRWLIPGCAVFLLAAGGASISYASEAALPGDFLYTIKKVNEHIRSGLHITPEAKANAETERAGRRMQEAKTLHEAAKLTDELSQSLDREFRVERRQAIQHITQLEAEGKVQSAARLRARLNAYEDGYQKILGDRSRRTEKMQGSVKSYPSIKPEVTAAGVAAAEMSLSSALSSILSSTSRSAQAGWSQSSLQAAGIPVLPLATSSAMSSLLPQASSAANASASAQAQAQASADARGPGQGARLQEHVQEMISETLSAAAANGTQKKGGMQKH